MARALALLLGLLVLGALVAATLCTIGGEDAAPPGAAAAGAPRDPSPGTAPPAVAATPATTAVAHAAAPARPPASVPPTGDDAPRGPTAAGATVARGGVVFAVVDPTGAPITGAQVVAARGERDLAEARTDGAGEARLAATPPCSWRVRATGRWPANGLLADGVAAVRVELAAAPRLRGRVFDAAGRVVAGARATLLPAVDGRLAPSPMPPPDAPCARTDAGGGFELPWPDGAVHDLVVTAPGHAPAIVAALAAATAPPWVAIALVPGATVAGRATTAAGEPLVGARVEAWLPAATAVPPRVVMLGPADAVHGQLLAATTTGANGAFALRDLPAASVQVLLAGEHRSAPRRVATAPAATTDVELVAVALATLRCRVDAGAASAAAAAGTTVFVHGGARFTRAADGTAVAFAGVPPGRYLVGAACAPVAEHVHAVVQQFLVHGRVDGALLVDVAAGDDRTLALPAPASLLGTVEGRVVFANAATPSAGTELVLALEPLDGPGAHRREGAIAADGTFRVGAVPPGDYDARVRQRGASGIVAESRCRVRAGDVSSVVLAAR